MKRYASYTIGVFALGILAFLSSSVSAQTLSLNDGSILRNNPHRMGVNIGAIDYWDNGQILKNLIGSSNPGFEPLQGGRVGNNYYFHHPRYIRRSAGKLLDRRKLYRS